MRTRTALILVVLAGLFTGSVWYFGLLPAPAGAPVAAAPGRLAFPDLTARLATAARVEITTKGRTLAILRVGEAAGAGAIWGLAERGNYPVQQDKLRELFTGLTELRLTEPRTADPALLERLGLGDPADATSSAALLRVLDGPGQALAELVVGHRRVRAQGNLPETIYVRRPGETQAWLAEGRLPVDADPQLWFDRDIANIDAKSVGVVDMHRAGAAELLFARDEESHKAALKIPAEHPKLDEYRVEDVFRALEMLTLTDVKPAAQQPGASIGTSDITLNDGTEVHVEVFAVTPPDAKVADAKVADAKAADAKGATAGTAEAREIWARFEVHGASEVATRLAARVQGWTYQLGSWKEKSFLPVLDELKAEEKAPAAAAPALAPASAPEAAPAAPAPEAAPAGGDAPKPE